MRRLERRVRGGGHDRLVDVAREHLVRAARRDPGQVGVRAVLDARALAVLGVRRLGRAARRRTRARPRACRSRPGRGRGRRATGGRRSAAPRTARAWGWARGRARGMLGRRAVQDAARLITVEGLDGAGKTTLVAGAGARAPAARARACRRAARARRRRAVRAHPRARQGPGARVDPRAEALLYAAARAQLVAEQLGRCSTRGESVLLDRFVDSSLAYQGAGRGLGVEEIRALNAFGTGGLTPDRTLLLRIDPAAGLRRGSPAATADRLEQEDARSSPRSPRPTTRSPPPSPSASRDRRRPVARAGARRRARRARAAAQPGELNRAPARLAGASRCSARTAEHERQRAWQARAAAQRRRLSSSNSAIRRPRPPSTFGSRRRRTSIVPTRLPTSSASASVGGCAALGVAGPAACAAAGVGSVGAGASGLRSAGRRRRACRFGPFGRRRRRRGTGRGRRLGRRLSAGLGALAQHRREVLRELVDELARDLLDHTSAHRGRLAAELDVRVDRPAGRAVVAGELHLDFGRRRCPGRATPAPALASGRGAPRACGRQSRRCPCRASTSARP